MKKVKLFVILVKLEAVTSKLVTREETDPEVRTKLDAVVSNNTTRGTKLEAVASVLVTLVLNEPEAVSKFVVLVENDPLAVVKLEAVASVLATLVLNEALAATKLLPVASLLATLVLNDELAVVKFEDVVSVFETLVEKLPLAVNNDPLVVSNEDKRLFWVLLVVSLLAVYVKILELNVCKAFILVLLLPVYMFTEAENEFKAPIDTSEPVMSPMSIPFNISEPVTCALCINICYDCLV